MCWVPFRMPEFLLSASKVFVLEITNRSCSWILAEKFLFVLCSFPLRTFTMHCRRNRKKFHCSRLKELSLPFTGKKWNSWRDKKVCALIIQRLWLLQSIEETNFLKNWYRCLCECLTQSIVCSWQKVNSKVTVGNRCCVLSPVIWLWSAAQLCIITRRNLGRIICMFWSLTSRPTLIWRDKLCFKFIVLNQPSFAAMVLTKKIFMTNFPHEWFKVTKYFVPPSFS